jgi:hypothetical protein
VNTLTHARGVLEGTHEKVDRARVSGARLLGMLHAELGGAREEVRAALFEHLGEVFDELSDVEADVAEAIDLLPKGDGDEEGSADQ